MKLMTLYPPTFAVDSLSRSNGSNGVLFAYYDNSHPFAAAIGAQEVCEGRPKFRAAILAMVVAGVVAYFYAPPLPGFPQWPSVAFAVLLAAFAVAMIYRLPGLRRKLELLGQAVECEVRALEYDTPHITAVQEAARQIAGYPQFGKMTEHELGLAIIARSGDAADWFDENERLIDRMVQHHDERGQ